ncbi:hypothetical protein NX801_07055 [Streptomyces sp. LP05-1]|uniref:Uncharacterized protein n=1 Tax=Streptomyces pyxinae TaxID=2970734 RepID=A0ABT2CDC8_9ACTN|nr:hypothetical protein [Streptomyces sp. LP05-1]MCS0635420.1 hypothetical protein [Streptomyces sp. LP05-1]
MATARLAPGVALVTVPGRGLAVRTPDGEFLRVDTGGVPEAALLAHLTAGRAPAAGGAAPQDRSARLAALTEAFEAAGHAVRTPPAPPLAGRTVRILGDARLTVPLARYAAEAGAEVEAADEQGAALRESGDPERTAVVWCLDRPVPPGLWDAADRALPARRTGWLRCHREGATAWLEPLAAGPGDVTAGHIRLRRLAATPAHRELAAYWEGHRAHGERDFAHTETSAALTAALLTADLIAWAGGAPRTVRRRLRRLDLRDLTLTGHPVLPVPGVAPLPAELP